MKELPVIQDPDHPTEPSDPNGGGSGSKAADPSRMTSDPLNTLKLKPPIIEALSTIYDPEIPVNIYDLGLIYDVVVDGSACVGIRMTLTAPACPAAQTLPAEVERTVRAIPGVTDATPEPRSPRLGSQRAIRSGLLSKKLGRQGGGSFFRS